MRNLVPNLRCLVLLFTTAVSLIYGWQGVTPNKALAQTGLAVREMTNVDKIFSNFMDRWNIPGGSISYCERWTFGLRPRFWIRR